MERLIKMFSLIKSIFGLIERVFFLFCYPDKLIKLALKHSPNANSKQIEKQIALVRQSVFRGFRISIGTALFSFIIFLILRSMNIVFGHRILLVFRFFGYMFILWGVFSPTGWKIQTFDGETLPEIIDEEWHRFVYMVGLALLLLSYLFEL
jgi:hypothetical protein